MYTSLQYINAEQTMIRATRQDGSKVIVEPQSGDLWQIILSGIFGEIAPFVPVPERPKPLRPNPVCDIFRVAMIAAQAVADGATDLTDGEILSRLKAAK